MNIKNGTAIQLYCIKFPIIGLFFTVNVTTITIAIFAAITEDQLVIYFLINGFSSNSNFKEARDIPITNSNPLKNGFV